ncbi:MAG: DUF357 domain-containing protein [Candidatus ainarchaeum sp.]|nr:DUF357 domain-containing protein [Candidatus ainarchaeum sp.]
MDGRARIEKDLREFSESLREVEGKKVPPGLQKALERAKSYYSDSRFFLEKGDVFTAWGTINYAHGLLDAVREGMGLEGYGALE